LEFSDETFDVVFGYGMLHHLDYVKSLREVKRCLKKDGIAIFKEPLDENLGARIARKLTPAARTDDEKPLRKEDLRIIKELFPNSEFHYHQLVSFLMGFVSGRMFRSPDNFLVNLGYKIDQGILKRWPGLGIYFRSVILVLRK
jgi:SAM-dependent methyltransferase